MLFENAYQKQFLRMNEWMNEHPSTRLGFWNYIPSCVQTQLSVCPLPLYMPSFTPPPLFLCSSTSMQISNGSTCAEHNQPASWAVALQPLTSLSYRTHMRRYGKYTKLLLVYLTQCCLIQALSAWCPPNVLGYNSRQPQQKHLAGTRWGRLA